MDNLCLGDHLYDMPILFCLSSPHPCVSGEIMLFGRQDCSNASLSIICMTVHILCYVVFLYDTNLSQKVARSDIEATG